MRGKKICGWSTGCSKLVDSGTRYCEQHRREHQWQGVDSKRSGTAEHRARQDRVLARDGHRCQIRYEDICLGHATTLDHIVALGLGGDDSDENCQAACPPCNQRKASLEGHAARGHAVELPPALPRRGMRTKPPVPQPVQIPRTLF